MEWTRGSLVYRVTHWGLELWSQILCILSSIGKENSKETFNFEKYFKSTAWTYFYLGFCKAIICFSPWTCSLEARAQLTALSVYAAVSSFIATVCNVSESIVETYPVWIFTKTSNSVKLFRPIFCDIGNNSQAQRLAQTTKSKVILRNFK